MLKLDKKKKKVLISGTAILLAAAIGAAAWFGLRGKGGDPVYVYEFDYVGMTEFWGDSLESYGPVSTDNIQTVVLSDTQNVTEVLVEEGQTVKKGDLLLSFDTTLSGLELEKKRLEAEKLKLQLEDEKKALNRINGMKPMQPLPPMEEPEPEEMPDLGPVLTQPYQLSSKISFDGSSPEKAMICWLQDGYYLDDAVIRGILQRAEIFQLENLTPQVPETTEETKSQPSAIRLAAAPELSPEGEAGEPADGAETDPPETNPPETDPPETDPPVYYPPVEDTGREYEAIDPPLSLYAEPDRNADVLGTADGNTVLTVYAPLDSSDGWGRTELWGETLWVRMSEIRLYERLPDIDELPPTVPETAPEENEGGETERPTEPAEPTKPSEPAEPTLPELPPAVPGTSGDVYVVLKITENNQMLGARKVWQGLRIRKSDGAVRFFNASGLTDHMMDHTDPEDSEMEMPEIDLGSGFTAADIHKMRLEQEKKIKDAELKVKMAEAEYKIMKREMDDGNIYAEFDGKVVSLLDEKEARKMKKPMLKLSGGGGYYVQGDISELLLDQLKVGMEVMVTDFMSGESCVGEVVSVGDFPLTGGSSYNGMNNRSASYYPFRVFVDGDANLQAGSYVQMTYELGGGGAGIYLEKPFLRTENGETFAYVLGKNDRLEKRVVKTGKTVWGSYMEILSGLSPEDLIAFPYGKNVKPGVKAELGDISQLYG